MSGVMKLVGPKEVLEGMEKFGFGAHRIWLGCLEIVVTLLYIVPATRRVGFYLVTSYLGGAMATHLGHADSPLGPMILNVVVWIGAYLSLPGFLTGAPSRREA